MYEQSKSQSASDRLQLEKIYNVLGDDDFAPKTIKVLKDELEAVKTGRDYLESLQKRHFEERNHFRQHYLKTQKKLSEANALIEEMRKGDTDLAPTIPDGFKAVPKRLYPSQIARIKSETLYSVKDVERLYDLLLESAPDLPK